MRMWFSWPSGKRDWCRKPCVKVVGKHGVCMLEECCSRYRREGKEAIKATGDTSVVLERLLVGVPAKGSTTGDDWYLVGG